MIFPDTYGTADMQRERHSVFKGTDNRIKNAGNRIMATDYRHTGADNGEGTEGQNGLGAEWDPRAGRSIGMALRRCRRDAHRTNTSCILCVRCVATPHRQRNTVRQHATAARPPTAVQLGPLGVRPTGQR